MPVALRDDTLLDASQPRSMRGPAVKHLRPAANKHLSPQLDKHLSSPPVKRLPRAAGSFVPGIGAELDQTEVQVGYNDQDELAGIATKRPLHPKQVVNGKVQRPIRHLNPGSGMLPGLGAFSDLFTGKNFGLLAVAAIGGYLLFKKK